MNSGTRIGIVVAALAALVVAFVVLAPAGDDEPGTTTAATATTPANTNTNDVPIPDEVTTQPPKPPPSFRKIRVKAGKPVGGVSKITVEKGERVRLEVSSPDTTDAVHIHGYDVSRDLKAGGSVAFAFKANAEGIFEIELEGSHTQIAQLTVEPG